MSTPTYRSHEPLYIVILRTDQAQKLLTEWSQTCCVAVMVKGNRMELYEHRALELFQMNWSHGWNNVTIWDCWNRRHIQ